MYADDTTVVYVGEDLSMLESHVNSVFVKFLDWCRYNKMALNPNKWEYDYVGKWKVVSYNKSVQK